MSGYQRGFKTFVSSPYLIVEHERIIIQGQGDCADQHILHTNSVLYLSSPVVAELTFSAGLVER